MHLKISVIVLLSVFCSYSFSTPRYNPSLKRVYHHSKTPTDQQEHIIVQTNKGKVLGKHNQTDTGTKYLAFQGIPYARPPINKLRFEVAQEFSWKGTWNATFERNECVQAITGMLLPVRGKEDCLYLNIYTQQLKNLQNLKPVMVWIYGGSYLFGSGNKDIYSPDYFLENDVVVVTFNYRLGVFGFLSSGDDVVPGNNGLKDQIFALKWIQENIAFFGGDPGKVTIMGESAGAASIGHLIQSDPAKGLFHQAILQSGTSIGGLVPPERIKKGFLLLGSAFGVTNGKSRDIVDKLKTVDYVSLLLYSAVITDTLKESVFPTPLYAPVLENKSASAVITTPPIQQLKDCRFNSVPLIVGFNSEEALTYAKGTKAHSGQRSIATIKKCCLLCTIFTPDSLCFMSRPVLDDQRYSFIVFDQNPENLVPSDLNVKGQCNAKDTGEKIKEHYVGKNGSFVFSPTGIIRYVSDNLFMRASVEYAKLYSNCNENTYLYRFSYNGGKNTTGAGHADELRYLFPTFPLISLREPLSETDANVSKNMVGLWSNFMKSGNPTPTPNNFDVTWRKSVSANNYEYINIDKELTTGTMENAPFKNDFEFFENLFNTCGRVEGV